MALYSPIVSSSLPAFPADTDLKFYFDYPKMLGDKDELAIQYTVASQVTNQSMLIGESLSQGILTVSPLNDSIGSYIIIPRSRINGGWKPGSIYKVQLRFVQELYGEFSEWSTVCYIKATGNTNDINVSILNADSTGAALLVESPKFFGQYNNPTDLSETELKYKFDLYEYSNGELMESTGWKLHHEEDQYDEVVFSYLLNDFSRYTVTYSVETKNGYKKEARFVFLCTFATIETPNIVITGESDFEEAKVILHIASEDKYSCNLILRRTDSRSDFTIWEDYKIFNILDEQIDIKFDDYLVEHGIEYKYGIQAISKEGYRGPLVKSDAIYVTYEHMYLVGNNKQLKIKFNPKISSWKRQLQETQTDTIGSKYPFVLRNGAVNYFTFPISGLISYYIDEAEAFCSKNSLRVSSQITTDVESNFDLDDNNIVLEREFRNQVEEFLTNGDFKYFKSATEGIKLVSMTSVSLQPNDTVGRMLYTFTSTAYEVGEPSLTNSLNKGIVSKGEYKDVEDMGERGVSGTLSFRVSTYQEDIYSKIKQQVEKDFGDYKRILKYLSSIKIEITNINVIPTAGYQIFLQQEQDGANTTIVISKELGFYELDNVIKIYGLKASTINAQMQIQYTAVCAYEQNEDSNTPSISDLKAVSQFKQIYNTFSDSKGNMDIMETVQKSDNRIQKIINFTYLRVDAQAGTKLNINGQEITIGDTESYEIKDIAVTSAKFIKPAAASVSVIYNGFIK